MEVEWVMTEEIGALWTMSTPIALEYNNAMQEFNDLNYTTSEQHRESSEAWMNRDHSDLEEIKGKASHLHTILSRHISEKQCNWCCCQRGGECAWVRDRWQWDHWKDDWKTRFLNGFSNGLDPSNRKTLVDDSPVKVAKNRTIDLTLPFQRFLKTGQFSLEDVMSYELGSFPAALFEGKEIFRKANKPQLVQVVTEFSSKKSNKTVLDSIPPPEHHVHDGGSLVHRLAWKRGDSYCFICRLYHTQLW